eukprot:1581423-Pleurochrysis_carterae.AAC.1
MNCQLIINLGIIFPTSRQTTTQIVPSRLACLPAGGGFAFSFCKPGVRRREPAAPSEPHRT